MDLAFRAIKQRPRLEYLQHRTNCSSTGALAGVAIEDPEQEKIEGSGTQRIVLPVVVDFNRGPAVLLRIVEELDPGMHSESDKSGRVGLPSTAVIPRPLAQHVFNHVGLLILGEDRAPAFPLGRIGAPDSRKGQYRFT